MDTVIQLLEKSKGNNKLGQRFMNRNVYYKYIL